MSRLREGAQVPLTGEASLLQDPRLGDLPGEGGVRVADVVAGVWSGKAEQEEERQGAKETRLGDPATMPPSSEPLDAPASSSLPFLVANAHSLPQKLECERLGEGNKGPGEDE